MLRDPQPSLETLETLETRDPRFWIGLGIALALGAILWSGFARATGIVLEDALITYRFAENLALGRGFAFNPGDPVLGTTTPLYTLLLAGLAKVFGVAQIPSFARIVLLVCALGATVFTALALLRLGVGKAGALAAAFLLVLHPDLLWSTAGGMETALVLLLMAGSLWAVATRRVVPASLGAALLVLARPDGIVWAVLVLAVLVADRKRAVVPGFLVFGVIVLAWIATAIALFGSAVPQTVVAKATVVGEGSLLHLFTPVAIRVYATYFAGWMPFPPGAGFSPFEFALGLGLAVLGVHALVTASRHPGRLLLAVFPFTFAAAYYVGQAPRSFPWYGIPVTWALLALTGVGVAGAARRVFASRSGGRSGGRSEGRSDEPARRRVLRFMAAGLALWLALSLGYEIALTYAYERSFQQNETATRRKIGEWIAANTAPDTRVAMEAIGYQAYYGRRPVIDLAGLVTPAVTRLRRASRSNAEVYRRVIDELTPGALVLRSVEVDENRHRDGGPFFESPGTRREFHRIFADVLRVRAPHPHLWADGASLTVYRRVAPGRLADADTTEGS